MLYFCEGVWVCAGQGPHTYLCFLDIFVTIFAVLLHHRCCFGIFACYYERLLDEVAFRIWNFEIWNF